jgi:hypothetical protein
MELCYKSFSKNMHRKVKYKIKTGCNRVDGREGNYLPG